MPNFPPQLSVYGYPNWFHHHGTKAMVIDAREGSLTIGHSGVFRVDITFDDTTNKWNMAWECRHGVSGGKTQGSIQMEQEQLEIAFGLKSAEIPSHSQWLKWRYGCHVAFQGLFIRWNDFLNIPCPGTGNDGDPNISIELGDRIKAAVAELLNHKPISVPGNL